MNAFSAEERDYPVRRHAAGPILWIARICYLTIFSILLFYIIWPLIGHSLVPPIPQKADGFSELVLAEDLQMRALRVFTVMWILTLGTSVGSFLNVVVYRSPRGKTLLGSSHCPRCHHRIRARHNLPVVGWMQLEGRCYDCRLPISARYPLVEATAGGVFLTLAIAELFMGGINLPLRPREIYAGITWILFFPRWDLISVYLFHTSMLCVLFSWALMQWDRMRIPPAYRLASFLVLMGLGWNFPHLYPVLASFDPELYFRGPPPHSGLATAVMGAVVGSVAGWLLAASGEFGWPCRHDLGPRRESLREVESGFCLTGLVLGWQAISSLAFLTSLGLIIALRCRLTARLENSWLVTLFVVTWCFLLAWRDLSDLAWWPGPLSSWPYHVVLLMLACGIIRWGQPPRFPNRNSLKRGPCG